MINFIFNAFKIIFLLGFLILIHEAGHFLVAKLCKVKVNEFAIGFGPTIWKKQGKETKYALRLIPLGGFVNLEGENESSDDERSFIKASVFKRICIVSAGALINIIFAIIVFFILFGDNTFDFLLDVANCFKNLFLMKSSDVQLVGPVGISDAISKTAGLKEYVYMLASISLSLGITNLLPFPPLDGGKILFLIIEAIRRKPIKQEIEIKIQLLGFAIILAISIYVAYNDIIKIL